MEKVGKFFEGFSLESFGFQKKGDIRDVKVDLASTKEEKQLSAVKRVIAAMTEGKDVSSLFMDVLKCMQTNNLELKKLVYLYVMNYAKGQSERAILAVNTFCKDATDTNPLVRALAIRTMSCIRVPQILEYLTQPLSLCLKDPDPYVRKTAAIAVAKLYDINPEAVIQEGFLDMLQGLLEDSNSMVVSNAVTALMDISDNTEDRSRVFKVDSTNLPKLLTALNECHEWGQVFILDCLATYKPRDVKEAENICERVSVRFNHSNSAVVLSAVKVVLLSLPLLRGSDLYQSYIRKLSPPLITLLSSGKEAEIQYVALRNMSLIVQQFPDVLRQEVKIFFCKYNDPIYVKLEKLELMIMLVEERNVDTVLSELKEYASMVDVEFVRKSVRAIGRIAIKLPGAADRCISVLLELIQTKVNYVVQEAVVVIKDIFRKYPNKYESIIATLCENLETLDEPDAKASMVWIIGEYADRIDNAADLLDRFLDVFCDENPEVQLQLLTAVVKLFLRKPDKTQEMVQSVLNKATQMTDNPDLRDRGFMYWRLLSADPEAAKTIVLAADKPPITDTSNKIEADLLQELIPQIGSLASVYHKPESTFIQRSTARTQLKSKRIGHDLDEDDEIDDAVKKDGDEDGDSAAPAADSGAAPAGAAAPAAAPSKASADLLDLDFLGPAPSSGAAPAAAPAPAQNLPSGNPLDLLLGGYSSTPAAAPAPAAAAPAAAPASSGMGVGFDFFTQAQSAPAPVPKVVILPAEKGDGMELSAAFVKENGRMYMELTCTNRGGMALSDFAMQYNKNAYGLTPECAPALGVVSPGQSADARVPILQQPAMVKPADAGSNPDVIQIAMKNSTGKIYFFTGTLPAGFAA